MQNFIKKREQRFTRGLTIVLFASLFLFGCDSKVSQNVESLTIIGTADLQGYMEPFEQEYDINGTKKNVMGGGIDRIATVLKGAKSKNPFGTLVFSSGDDLMGRYFHTFKGEAIYSLMDKSGYEFYALGNHEFDKGSEVLADALDFVNFDILCSDLQVEDTALEGKCISFKIIEVNSAKIGLFSLMTEEFPFVTIPGKVKLKTNNLEAAKIMVALLKEKGCNIIIAVTHIGLEQDKHLAQNVGGIDVIFGGHSHRESKELVRVDETLIVNAGEQGAYVVKLDIPFDRENILKKDEASYRLIPIISSIASNDNVASMRERYKSQLPATIVLGKTTVPWDLTTETLRTGEANVPDLINDLLHDKFAVDIVMNNAGAFRGKKVYPPGNITDTMLHEIDEFSNNAYIMNMEGKYLRQVLEHSAALYAKGGLMQVAGLHYIIDLSKEAQELKQNSDGSVTIIKEGKRVSEIHIVQEDGTLEPLDNSKKYKLLSNAYLVNHSGDGYFWFSKYGTEQKNTYTTFYTIMSGYLEKYKMMDPKLIDGRLKIIGR